MLDKTSSIICAFGLASAAPRSPYRHLELCGIAQELYFAAQTIADTAELYWDKPDTAGAEAEYHLFVDDERMAVMNPLDAGRFAAGAFLLRPSSEITKKEIVSCTLRVSGTAMRSW